MQPWLGAYCNPWDHRVQQGRRKGGRRMWTTEECARTLEHPEEHHSVSEHTSGEPLHAAMQKSLIHEALLPAAVTIHLPQLSQAPAQALPDNLPTR